MSAYEIRVSWLAISMLTFLGPWGFLDDFLRLPYDCACQCLKGMLATMYFTIVVC